MFVARMKLLSDASLELMPCHKTLDWTGKPAQVQTLYPEAVFLVICNPELYGLRIEGLYLARLSGLI